MVPRMLAGRKPVRNIPVCCIQACSEMAAFHNKVTGVTVLPLSRYREKIYTVVMTIFVTICSDPFPDEQTVTIIAQEHIMKGEDVKEPKKPFKICNMCGCIWFDREDFLDDENIMFIGYQADFERLEYGLFYFNHTVNRCSSTIAIYTREFLDMYKGEVYAERCTGKENCPGYCMDVNQLQRCDVCCECAMVREVSHIISLPR